MTVHVISVGATVLEHLGNPRRFFTDRSRADAVETSEPWRLLRKADAHRSGTDASTWLASALAPADDPAHSPQAAKLLAETAAAAEPSLWPPELSAELSTFARVPKARRPVPKTDIALLICSDTADGLLAGLWNAAALTGGKLDKVRYAATPDEIPGDLWGNCAFARVPGLEVGTDPGFRKAMRGLGTLVRNVLDRAKVSDSEPFWFHLSGGFKASIPYLIGIAEGVRSLNPGRDVQACVLHETTQASVIKLPLRRLVSATVRNELHSFDATGIYKDKLAPGRGTLEGYAYERDGNRAWRLTSFGEGLRELYPRTESLQQ